MANIIPQGTDQTTGQLRTVTPQDSLSAPGTGLNSEHFGANSQAGSTSDLAVGRNANTNTGGAGFNTAIGHNSSIQGTANQSVAVGQVAICRGSNSVAVGQGATSGSTVTDTDNVVIGFNAQANNNGDNGTSNITIGSNTNCKGTANILVGFNASIPINTSVGNVVIGRAANCQHSGNIIIGRDAFSTADNQLVMGSSNGFITTAYLGNGVTNSAPQNITLNATGGTGVAVAGATFNLAGGISGDAGTAGGNVNIQTARTGTATSLTNAVIVSGTDGSISCPGSAANSERFGATASASGISSLAVGFAASASAQNAVALGASTTAATNSAVAIGHLASVTTTAGGISIGAGTSNAAGGVNIGGSILAGGSNATVLGIAAQASAVNATALGSASNVTATRGLAIGVSANVANSDSIAIGSDATTTASNQLVIGGPVSTFFISNVYIGNGVTNAAPQNIVYNATGSSTNGTAGANFTIAGGLANQNTDSGGSVIIKTAQTSNGTNLVNRTIVNAVAKNLTSATPVGIISVNVPTGTMTGGQICFTIQVTDGADYQVVSGNVYWTAFNQTGTAVGDASANTLSSALSTGTLTITADTNVTGATVTIRVTATTSLTPTTFNIQYQVENNSTQDITIL